MIRCKVAKTILLAGAALCGLLSGCGFPAGGYTFSIKVGDMGRLTNDQPQFCRLMLAYESHGSLRFPGSSVKATIKAPETITCIPANAKLVLDESGKAEWLVEMRLARKDVQPGREKVIVVFEHESGRRKEYSFDVDVGP